MLLASCSCPYWVPGCPEQSRSLQGLSALPQSALQLPTRISCLVQNAGTEAAMEWVLSHMEDPDFNEPLPASSSSQATAQAQQQSSQKAADPEQVSMLGAMGFTPQQVTYSPPRAMHPFSLNKECFSSENALDASGWCC